MQRPYADHLLALRRTGDDRERIACWLLAECLDLLRRRTNEWQLLLVKGEGSDLCQTCFSFGLGKVS